MIYPFVVLPSDLGRIVGSCSCTASFAVSDGVRCCWFRCTDDLARTAGFVKRFAVRVTVGFVGAVIG